MRITPFSLSNSDEGNKNATEVLERKCKYSNYIVFMNRREIFIFVHSLLNEHHALLYQTSHLMQQPTIQKLLASNVFCCGFSQDMALSEV
jgi:hypothetical protein